MKVVVFTVKYGNGHSSVANEVKRYLETKGDYEVVVRNPHREFNKPITYLVEQVYIKIICRGASNKYLSWIYEKSFDLFGNKHSNIFSKFGSKKIKQIAKEENADAVVLTFPFYTYRLPVSTYSIITDYGFSKIWYSKNVDKYIVGNNEVKTDLLEYVEDKNIHTLGIPVNENFNPMADNEIKNITINLGAIGVGSAKNVSQIINEIIGKDLNVEVICGKNQKIYEELRVMYNDKSNVIVHGFVTNMYEIYNRSHLLVTKAGGITISEAIASETPIIISETLSLSGQESYNIDFIKKYKLGKVVANENIGNAIFDYLDNKDQYLVARKQMLKLNEQYKVELADFKLSVSRD